MRLLGVAVLAISLVGCEASTEKYEKAKAALEVAEADLSAAKASLEDIEKLTNQLPEARWPEGTAITIQERKAAIANAEQARAAALETLRGLSN